MVIKTGNLKRISKVLGMIPSAPKSLDDFVFIDAKSKYLYISNKDTACKVELDIENVVDESILVIDRSMFQHLINSADEITLTSDYHYTIGQFSGIIEHNDILIESLDAIKSYFNEDTFDLLFTVDSTILDKLTKANYFVNPDDNNYAQRGIHIIDKKVASSSLFRMYVDSIDIESENPLFIQYDILKFIFELGINTSILKNDNLIKIINGNTEIVFTAINKVTPLAISAEKFVNSITELRNNNSIQIDVNTILPKIDFMLFFSRNNNNNLSTLCIDADNTAKIIVGENVAKFTCEASLKEENIKFNYDNNTLKEVLTKINKNVEKVKLFTSSTSNIFLIEFTEEQYVVLAKIKE